MNHTYSGRSWEASAIGNEKPDDLQRNFQPRVSLNHRGTEKPNLLQKGARRTKSDRDEGTGRRPKVHLKIVALIESPLSITRPPNLRDRRAVAPRRREGMISKQCLIRGDQGVVADSSVR